MRARLQNIKISKYLETRRLTEDVFGECGRKPWRGDTPHAREPLTMSKIKITVISGFRTEIAVVAKYRAKITGHCRGFWLPYKNYCGDQLPCNNYRALPWWLATVQSIPWLPITVHQLLCNAVVAVYRGKRYRDEKSLSRKALQYSTSRSTRERNGRILLARKRTQGYCHWGTRLCIYSLCNVY